MSKIKNHGLNQYGAGPFKQQQFGTAGVQGVRFCSLIHTVIILAASGIVKEAITIIINGLALVHNAYAMCGVLTVMCTAKPNRSSARRFFYR